MSCTVHLHRGISDFSVQTQVGNYTETVGPGGIEGVLAGETGAL